jgi:hypothetical protein
MVLSNKEQIPIDKIVKEHTVARLIVKNLLNDKLRAHLITVVVTGDDCYPNSISDALSLFSTFAKTKKESATEDAMVSYHEATQKEDVIECDETIPDDSITITGDSNVEIDETNDLDKAIDIDSNMLNNADGNYVTFNETVMASIIAKATADTNED